MIHITDTIDLQSDTYKDALDIRKEVFVNEQHVPLALEIENEESCIHFVLYEDNTPQATVRLFPKKEGIWKVQRMAVAKEARQKGYGQDIMRYAEQFAQKKQATELLLGAQTQAIPFYEKLGFNVFGEEYLDAGIKHFDMKKSLQ